PLGPEAIVEEADHRIPSRSAPNAEVEDGAHRCSASPDHAPAAELPALAGMRRNPNQRGDLLMTELPQFGELGEEGASQVGADTGHRLKEIALFGPDRALPD